MIYENASLWQDKPNWLEKGSASSGVQNNISGRNDSGINQHTPASDVLTTPVFPPSSPGHARRRSLASVWSRLLRLLAIHFRFLLFAPFRIIRLEHLSCEKLQRSELLEDDEKRYLQSRQQSKSINAKHIMQRNFISLICWIYLALVAAAVLVQTASGFIFTLLFCALCLYTEAGWGYFVSISKILNNVHRYRNTSSCELFIHDCLKIRNMRNFHCIYENKDSTVYKCYEIF